MGISCFVLKNSVPNKKPPARINMNTLNNALIGLDNVSIVEKLEELINSSQNDHLDAINSPSLPLRSYLELALLPTLIEGLKLVSKDRYEMKFT